MAGFFSKLRLNFKVGGHHNNMDDYYFDPLATDYVNDPYPYLKYLREQSTLHRSKSGAWLITSYEDVVDALENDNLSNEPSLYAVVSRRNISKYTCSEVANNILPFIDAPKHSDKRFAMGRSYFTSLKSDKSSIFSDLDVTANRILYPLKQQGTFDVIHQFGTLFSGEVICRFMGLPVKDLSKLAAWGEHFLYLFSFIPSENIRQQIDKSLQEFRLYLKNIIEQKRFNPQNDWISAIVFDQDQLMQNMTEAEIIDNLMLFFADGIENIDRAFGTAIKLLLENPDQLAEIKNDLSLIDVFVDEVLRFETPAQFIGRVAKSDIEIKGQLIKKQTPILLMLSAANRDPKQFKNPDQLSIFESRKGVLSFGKGAHSCIGKVLVKKQIVAGLNAILAQCHSIKALEKFEWQPRIGHRWLKTCLIKVN